MLCLRFRVFHRVLRFAFWQERPKKLSSIQRAFALFPLAKSHSAAAAQLVVYDIWESVDKKAWKFFSRRIFKHPKWPFEAAQTSSYLISETEWRHSINTMMSHHKAMKSQPKTQSSHSTNPLMSQHKTMTSHHKHSDGLVMRQQWLSVFTAALRTHWGIIAWRLWTIVWTCWTPFDRMQIRATWKSLPLLVPVATAWTLTCVGPTPHLHWRRCSRHWHQRRALRHQRDVARRQAELRPPDWTSRPSGTYGPGHIAGGHQAPGKGKCCFGWRKRLMIVVFIVKSRMFGLTVLYMWNSGGGSPDFGGGQIFWLQASNSVLFGTPHVKAQNDKIW